MVVNTRATVKAQKKVKDTPTAGRNKEEVTNQVFWKTDRPSEVNKILKIKSEVKRNGIVAKQPILSTQRSIKTFFSRN